MDRRQNRYEDLDVQVILNETNDAESYHFVFVRDSLEHDYYRWRVLSIFNGDTLESYRTIPYLLAYDGILYYPPVAYDMPSYT
jgi:U2-associated protein SR140